MSDLADWFAGIDSLPLAAPDRPADAAVAVLPATGPDLLALAWCDDSMVEMRGVGGDPSGTLPLLCRGCKGLAQGRCTVLATVPDSGSAALCRRFAPRVGVRVGRCWLWRVQLEGERLVWWCSTPPLGQAEAIRRVRQLYGEAVRSVWPVPGMEEIPGG